MVHAVLMALFVWDLTHRQQIILLNQQADQAEALAYSVATSSAGWVASKDLYGLQEIITAQSRYPELAFAFITDTEGKVLAHTDLSIVGKYSSDLPSTPQTTTLSRTAQLMDVASPVLLAEQHIGWVRIGLTQKKTAEQLDAVTRDGGLYTIAAILIGSLMAWFMGVQLTRKLEKIRQSANAVQRGDLSNRVPDLGDDETGVTALAFNEMLDTVVESNHKLTEMNLTLEKANHAQSMSEARMKVAADAAGIGIWDFNIDKNELIWDEQMYTLYGVTSDTFSGAYEAWANGLHPDDRQKAEQSLSNALDTDGVFHTTFRVIHPDSKVRWIKADAWTHNDPFDGCRHMIGVNQDITRQKEDEIELNNRQLQLEQASEAKSNFLSNMSHEIRTPMNGVIGVTQLLRQSELNTEQNELIDVLEETSNSLLHIINDILDLSKLDSGHIELEVVDFNMQDMITNTAFIFKHNASAKGIELRHDLANDVDGYFRGDVGRLRQVLMNLINNAIKFTEQGSVTIKVALEIKQSDVIKFEIIDTGVGIDESSADALFDEFIQADASISRKFGGTGLGLAICKRIVTCMNGEIGAIKNTANGSTFWFKVPLESVDQNLIEAEDFIRSDQVFGKSLNILLAEDVVPNQLIAKKFFERMGHTVQIAANGLEAVSSIQNREFDIIFMDMQMPEMDGCTATQKIRQMDHVADDLPIIAVTANVNEEDRQKCLDAGMNDFISKPIQFEALKSMTFQWTENKQSLGGYSTSA